MEHTARQRSAILGGLLTRVVLLLLLLGTSSFGSGCTGEPPACSTLNLLDRDTPVDSHGVVREQRMVDGMAPEPGARLNDFVTAYFASPNAHVTYDLGRVQQVAAVQIVTNNTAPNLVSQSVDGAVYLDVPLEDDAEAPPSGQLLLRHSRSLDARLRYLRVEMAPHQSGRAVAEVLAFCRAPTPYPATLEVPESRKQRVGRVLLRKNVIYGVKAGLAIIALALLLLLGHKLLARPRGVAIVLAVVGALGLARFGDLVGDGQPIHEWDAMHYYLGSKYFPELGYWDLYRCIAKHERESGRGSMIDSGKIRNLDDYVIYSGDWTATPAGSCRAEFSSERWRAFGEDVDRFRRLFDISHFHAALQDHGYNATPIQTAWLSPLTNIVPSTRAGLRAFVTLDWIAVALSAIAIGWAFGPLAGGLCLVVLGLGAPWSTLWTGGSIGRFAWLGLLCGGVALLKNDRNMSGAALVTLSGLLRLFPLVFVASMLLKIAVDGVRERELRPASRQMLLGIAIAVTLAGAIAVRDAGVFAEFIDNTVLHATILPPNQLGLGILASLAADGPVREALRGGDRSPEILLGGAFWATGLLLAGVFLLRRLWRPNRPTWEAVSFAAPLLYASIPLAGYDYAWLLVLVPMLVASPHRIAMLLVALAALDVGALTIASVADQHALASGVIGLLLVSVFWHERRAVDPEVDR